MGEVIPFPASAKRHSREPDPGRDEPGEPAGWAVPGVDREAADPPPPSSRRAQNVSMAALTAHDGSEGELRARLERKGLEPDDIDAELTRLRSVGLLDDRAFADRLIVRLRDRKGLGDGALRLELRQRLIPAEVVEAAIADAVEDDEVAHERLLEVALDRARRLGGLPPEVAERRLLAYLQRRGFPGGDAREAARQALRSR